MSFPLFADPKPQLDEHLTGEEARQPAIEFFETATAEITSGRSRFNWNTQH
jgi:hypothetical protein